MNLLGIGIKYATLDPDNVWRSLKCELHTDNMFKQRCKWCVRLMNISRAMKSNIQLSLKLNRKKRLGPTLTPTRTETLKHLFKTKHNIQKSNLR